MKKTALILCLSVFLLSFLSFNKYDFFSSMTKVDYIDGSKTLKFTTKLNTTHLAKALKIEPSNNNFEAEIKKHVNNNFEVSINGSPKTLTFTGSQVNGETVWVYYEVGNVPAINNLKFKNSILVNQYPKQINIVNVSYKGNLKTLNFLKGKETGEVNY